MQAFFQNSHQEVNGDGSPNLRAYSVGAGAIKGFDAQMLLDPFEKQLDLPPAAIEIGDGDCR